MDRICFYFCRRCPPTRTSRYADLNHERVLSPIWQYLLNQISSSAQQLFSNQLAQINIWHWTRRQSIPMNRWELSQHNAEALLLWAVEFRQMVTEHKILYQNHDMKKDLLVNFQSWKMVCLSLGSSLAAGFPRSMFEWSKPGPWVDHFQMTTNVVCSAEEDILNVLLKIWDPFIVRNCK